MNKKIISNHSDRLDKILKQNFPDLSREKLISYIESNEVKVNDVIVNSKHHLIKKNDIIEVIHNQQIKDNQKLVPWDKKELISILFENEHYLIIEKPKNLLVHPTNSNKEHTLVNILLSLNIPLAQIETERPGIVHRLDKDTTGIMIIAKTDKFYYHIQNQFEKRKVIKKYLGITDGNFIHEKGLINVPIGKDQKQPSKMNATLNNSKEALTEFRVLKHFKNQSLVEFNLMTGRTHQIRVHAKYLQTPILNDPLYGKEYEKDLGQYLHSYYLEFVDLDNQKQIFKNDLPKYFSEKLLSLE